MTELEKLYGIFVDEALERICEFEDGLLLLERSPQDRELINSIFRAAHTIKGSSSSIGLNDISKFTHSVEEILELVRQNKLHPTKGLINVLLAYADLVKEMIGSVATATAFDFSRCDDLMSNMNAIKNKISEKQFKIIFIPNHSLLKKGIDPAAVISGLTETGEILNIKAYTDEVPSLSEINPEELYLRWDILVKTDKDLSDIKKVFQFVEEESEIKIFPVTMPEKEPLIGQMLVDEGAVKAEDVVDALKSQKRIGDILIEQDRVAVKDIEKIVEKQKLKKIDSLRNSVSSTIRVDLNKLDNLINIVGEMFIAHSILQQIIAGMRDGEEGIRHENIADFLPGLYGAHAPFIEDLNAVFAQLQRIGSDIRESAMSLRMLPVREVFRRFIRLARELPGNKNKKVGLVISGEETELDKGILEKITDPIVHIIRNAIDHGIETIEEREAKGKPAQGTIHLVAYQMGDSVYIEIEDDGRGLNKEKILQKALSRGVINDIAGLTDEQIYNLIFLPGFSTSEEVTDFSGRGVGMDVVKRNVESLNGKVKIHTRPDIGTTISIKLPLTLAIIEGLSVLVGDEIYIIPLTSVIESLRPMRNDVKTLNERGEVIHVRGEFIPLIRLHEELGIIPRKKEPSEAIVVLVGHENKKCCLLVDDLMGQQQVVIKNLGSAVSKVFDIAGGAILGNGRVALVLDIPGIIEKNRGVRCEI